MKEGNIMMPRRKRWWQVLAMGAVTLLLLAMVLAVGLNAGPDERAPGPEKYHMYHEKRQGLQTEAVFLNASPAAEWMEDDNYSGYEMRIVLGKSLASSYIETYDGNGFIVSSETVRTWFSDASAAEYHALADRANQPLLQIARYPWRGAVMPHRLMLLPQE